MNTLNFLQEYENFQRECKNSLRGYKKEEISLIKTIRDRLREARELNDLTPKQAARLLKIDSKFLIDIETGGNGVHGIPLKLILEATAAYEVSLDFLFGLENVGDTFEGEAARDICRFVRFYQSRMFEHWAAKQLQLETQMAVVNDAAKDMLHAVSEIIEAMSIFKKRNPDFDDMPAGARLQTRIKFADTKTRKAYVRLRKVFCIAGPGKRIEDHYQK